MLAASGEETSDIDDEDDGSSSTSTSTSSSVDSDVDGETTGVHLKSLIRNVSGGCGGIGHALRRWSCHGTTARRRTRAGGREKGSRGAGGAEAKAGKEGSAGAMRGGGEAPRWIPDDEKEACMLCDRK